MPIPLGLTWTPQGASKDGIKALADMLTVNQTLQSLSLRANTIDSQSCRLVCTSGACLFHGASDAAVDQGFAEEQGSADAGPVVEPHGHQELWHPVARHGPPVLLAIQVLWAAGWQAVNDSLTNLNLSNCQVDDPVSAACELMLIRLHACRSTALRLETW